MNFSKIYKMVAEFEALAGIQDDSYDGNLRNLIVNTRPDSHNFSFREVANVVLQDLTALDRNEKNPEVTQASHSLLDILNSMQVPNPNSMLSSSQSANSAIQQGYPNNPEKTQISKYLVSLTQALINKFFNKPQKDNSGVDNTQKTNTQKAGPSNMPAERTDLFLQKIFGILRGGKSLSEDDISKWNNYRTFYLRRLNGLKSLSNRTPQQNEEKYVIEFVLNKLQ